VNFELNDEQEMLRSTIRDFLETQVPVSKVRALADVPAGYEEQWWKQAAELGFTAMLVPEDDGGGTLSGKPATDVVIIAEEAGRMMAPGPIGPVNIVAYALAESGTPAQKSQWLPALIGGEVAGAWAVTEDAHDPLAMTTTIELDASGDHVIVNGHKAYVEAGGEASVLLVAGNTSGGVTQVLVPADAAGVTVHRRRSLDLVRRYVQVEFDGVSLPVGAVVGRLGEARADLDRQLALAIVLQSAETVGVLDRSFDMAMSYSRERYTFGRPIAAYQAIKHRLADMKLVLETAKGTSDALARAFDEQDPQLNLLASVTKAYVSEQASPFVSECVQLFGGIGMTYEHDIHLYLRRAAVNRTIYGTPEFHRERIATLIGVSDSPSESFLGDSR
jgi:alkylation response protein AidB-like acyl-CoA dehydrogenase